MYTPVNKISSVENFTHKLSKHVKLHEVAGAIAGMCILILLATPFCNLVTAIRIWLIGV